MENIKNHTPSFYQVKRFANFDKKLKEIAQTMTFYLIKARTLQKFMICYGDDAANLRIYQTMSTPSTQRKKGKQHFFIGVVLTLMVAAALAGYFTYTRYYPSTQDSYIHANISTVSAQVNGRVNTVNITDLSLVKAGDVLFTLDKAPFQIQLDQALANLAKARQIVAIKHAPGKDDNPLIREAKANLAGAQLALKNTTVRAPASGQAVNVRLRKGDNIAAGMPLFAIVEQQNGVGSSQF